MKATPWMILTDLSTNIWAVMALSYTLSAPAVLHQIDSLPVGTHLIKEVGGQFYELEGGAWNIVSGSLSDRLNIGCDQSCLSLFGAIENQPNNARYYASLPPEHKLKSDALYVESCLHKGSCQLTVEHSNKGVSLAM